MAVVISEEVSKERYFNFNIIMTVYDYREDGDLGYKSLITANQLYYKIIP